MSNNYDSKFFLDWVILKKNALGFPEKSVALNIYQLTSRNNSEASSLH
jgi:hypothetical protein